ncbi:hypothetical protein [Mycoplasmopsis bovigenitalium]|uniref:hypothetical protein n=1 Tax=Mycoplasmopsis bovigenitalium TaxID=2112 RepID=UPI000BBB5D1E|nr:hypothetical protein [Mycoplasmopsis bovigenitalium]
MAKTKIILASTLSVLAVASVTTAAVVVTQKRKKQNDNPKNGNQVVVATDSKFEYALSADQTKELSAKLLLVKGQDVTVTLTENNSSKTIKTKVKEDGTVDFSNLKDGKTYIVTKIVVKDGDKERDLIAEVKAPKTEPNKEVKPGDTTNPMDPIQGDNPGTNGGNSGSETKPTEGTEAKPNDADGKKPKAGGADAGTTGSQGAGTEGGDKGTTGSQGAGTEGGAQAGNTAAGGTQTNEKEAEIKKITIVQQQYDKSTGYINFWFKTTKENFEKMRTKSWNMEFQLGNNYQNELTPAAKVGTSGDENVGLIKESGNEVIIFMSTNYYYNKATKSPQTTYKLINLYYDNNKSNNVLSEPSKDIQVKYE